MSIFKFTTMKFYGVLFNFQKKKGVENSKNKTKTNSQVEVQCYMNLHKLRKREVSITWSQHDVWTNHKAHHNSRPTTSCYIIYFVTNVRYIKVIKNFIILFGSENSCFLPSYESHNSHIQVPIEEFWKWNKL